ncbi:hypothetical protein O181_029411 [Austropuccinia psidii MF-1]|uniref:Uncharacterized protein n=1 Tax=Austropuccinia psidii MF-1 TaxID=1389203 RepID=A0A9Q3CWE6_9BASI|nr:hypothetical protein [Austropuccinia psidii MF-1]
MDQVLKIHQFLKDLFQWSLYNKSLNLVSHRVEVGAIFRKIGLKELPLKDLMVITKGWDPNQRLKLLEEMAARIRVNLSTSQAIGEQLNKTEPTLIYSGSKGVNQPYSPSASHHSGTRRSVTKSHHSSQFHVVSRRRQVSKGKNKTSFNQRQKESDPMI